MRRHRRFHPAGWYRRPAFGRHKSLPGLASGLIPHAAVRSGADDRRALEQLCHYITRPALANERVQTNAAGLAAESCTVCLQLQLRGSTLASQAACAMSGRTSASVPRTTPLPGGACTRWKAPLQGRTPGTHRAYTGRTPMSDTCCPELVAPKWSVELVGRSSPEGGRSGMCLDRRATRQRRCVQTRWKNLGFGPTVVKGPAAVEIVNANRQHASA